MTDDLFEGSSVADLYGTTKETTEIIVGVNTKGEDMVLVVAEAQNKDHRRMIRKYQRKLESCERRGDDKGKREIYAEIAALTLLRDWRGFIDKDGNEIEATPANKIAALKKFHRMAADVIDASMEIKNFQDEDEEAVTKN